MPKARVMEEKLLAFEVHWSPAGCPLHTLAMHRSNFFSQNSNPASQTE
eukprot:CAMPEP_0204281266 /NCGR_PEP_ID=MMETSP0468-20130131/40449_1 /ASSEMBLY_ACC=CAM_ASM_000383 /TAXON_ID=2969 /ORGANISM="Oxyrrhis marina" /LENGTH=47 /DNA_ID= /DNA_START= /DNA_END= /DNA_ORIENTATION=